MNIHISWTQLVVLGVAAVLAYKNREAIKVKIDNL